MSCITKFSRIKSLFASRSSSSSRRNDDEEKESSLGSKSSIVNHEYLEAFRTKSYVEIYNKVQVQFQGINNIEVDGKNDTLLPSTSAPSSSSPPPQLPRLHETLTGSMLQLCQETLTELPQQAIDAHPLLNEYFTVSSEACKTCESLLKKVVQTRNNYKTIKRQLPGDYDEKWSSDEMKCMYSEFATFSSLVNPLSSIARVRFDEVQDGHFRVLHRLISKRRKIKRRLKLIRVLKRALGGTLVVGYTAFAITLTILAIHCVVCAMAAPGMIAATLAISRLRRAAGRGARRGSTLEELYAQLDTAARGIYISINDFDTVSRLVGRLHDEIEHNRALANLCTRKHNDDMLKEVMRDFNVHEEWFMEQLKELEQHVYLCFLNIIRSRRMVVQEIVGCENTTQNS